MRDTLYRGILKPPEWELSEVVIKMDTLSKKDCQAFLDVLEELHIRMLDEFSLDKRVMGYYTPLGGWWKLLMVCLQMIMAFALKLAINKDGTVNQQFETLGVPVSVKAEQVNVISEGTYLITRIFRIIDSVYTKAGYGDHESKESFGITIRKILRCNRDRDATLGNVNDIVKYFNLIPDEGDTTEYNNSIGERALFMVTASGETKYALFKTQVGLQLATLNERSSKDSSGFTQVKNTSADVPVVRKLVTQFPGQTIMEFVRSKFPEELNIWLHSNGYARQGEIVPNQWVRCDHLQGTSVGRQVNNYIVPSATPHTIATWIKIKGKLRFKKTITTGAQADDATGILMLTEDVLRADLMDGVRLQQTSTSESYMPLYLTFATNKHTTVRTSDYVSVAGVPYFPLIQDRTPASSPPQLLTFLCFHVTFGEDDSSMNMFRVFVPDAGLQLSAYASELEALIGNMVTMRTTDVDDARASVLQSLMYQSWTHEKTSHQIRWINVWCQAHSAPPVFVGVKMKRENDDVQSQIGLGFGIHTESDVLVPHQTEVELSLSAQEYVKLCTGKNATLPTTTGGPYVISL